MHYEWHPAQAAGNLRKHGIHLADAVGALGDPFALTVPDHYPREPRWNTLGRDYRDRVIVLCWMYAGPERIRLISARTATPRERRQYAEDGHEQER